MLEKYLCSTRKFVTNLEKQSTKFILRYETNTSCQSDNIHPILEVYPRVLEMLILGMNLKLEVFHNPLFENVPRGFTFFMLFFLLSVHLFRVLLLVPLHTLIDTKKIFYSLQSQKKTNPGFCVQRLTVVLFEKIMKKKISHA